MAKKPKMIPSLKERFDALSLDQQVIVLDDICCAIDNRLQVFERINNGGKQ